MKYIRFRKIQDNDAQVLSQLLLDSPPDYLQYFNPFDFQENSMKKLFQGATKDQFFAIELISQFTDQMVGFYMLRGLDEGYSDPMYGIFVSHQYKGNGIARLSINHAECFCKINNIQRLLLKVYPENIKAKSLYELLGFKFFRKDNKNQQTVLYKNILELKS